MKIIKIRLGGMCNQHCTFCHSDRTDRYEFNPKLIPFIKYNNFDKIHYGGGEPLIYWEYMKMFLDTFPNIRHHVVTNGSLFNDEMLEYTLKRNFRVGISLNEFTNLSDSVIQRLSQVPELGYGIVYSGERSLDEIDLQVEEMNNKLHQAVHTAYNLMHTTTINSKSYTKKQMDDFIVGVDKRIRKCIEDTLNNVRSKYDVLTYLTMNHSELGTLPGCNNRNFYSVTLDGRIMECTYDKSYIGTIENYIPYHFVNKPECYNCKWYGRCNSCYKSINNDECYILNKVFNNLEQALIDYKLTRKELYDNLDKVGDSK